MRTDVNRSTRPGPAPSAAIDAPTWDHLHTELVGSLQDLVRINTINPPGGEIAAARYLEGALGEAGVSSTILEPFPERGSIVARLRGDGTGGGPLLLLSHLDVVPAPPENWTHDPLGGDIADGYLWGRGTLDMKGMVAMELAVVRRLAAEARAVGRDPAADPIPGFSRDIIFAATADEEAGGFKGAGWLVDHHPELLAAEASVNEAGGVSLELAGTRFYPIQVGEKGMAWYRLMVRGEWGHGSVPRAENAAVRAAEIVQRLAAPGKARLTPSMSHFIEGLSGHLPGALSDAARSLDRPSGDRLESALRTGCPPAYVRTARALVRDTISPTIIRAGLKTNVIPGVAEIEIDCRPLPGTSEESLRNELRARIGEELWASVEPTLLFFLPALEQPIDHPLYTLIAETLTAHDPDGIPVPIMAPFGTDAKHTSRLGTVTFGFSPLRLRPEDRFLELFHGDDERVSLDALRFGLPALYDVVRAYCA